MSFRNSLKHYIEDDHSRLENHPKMTLYSSGTISEREFVEILTILSSFWHSACPDNNVLPQEYRSFLSEYRAALSVDIGCPAGVRHSFQKEYDEVAFFYLLLGSSHGARFMLKKLASTHLPISHIKILSERGPKLWKPFIDDHLETVNTDRRLLVRESAKRIFTDLHLCLSY